MRTRSVVMYALIVAVVVGACGSTAAYAAKVDGVTITQSQLEGEMRSIAVNDAYVKKIEETTQVKGAGAGDFDVAFTGLVLGREVQYVLIDREITKRKITLTPADRQAARTEVAQQVLGEDILSAFPKAYQDTLVDRAAKVSRLTLALSGSSGGDDALKAYYEAHKTDFTEACVSHILVTTKDKADQLKAKIAGGADFATVAKAESKDTGSAAQGGDLGCRVDSDSFALPEFIKAMLSQPVGQVGDPVQTQYGFHLILVRSRTVPPYDQVVDRVKDAVVTANSAKLQDWLNAAVASAKISVNPRYGTFNKQTYKVDPPTTTTVPQPSTTPVSGIVPLQPK